MENNNKAWYSKTFEYLLNICICIIQCIKLNIDDLYEETRSSITSFSANYENYNKKQLSDLWIAVDQRDV